MFVSTIIVYAAADFFCQRELSSRREFCSVLMAKAGCLAAVIGPSKQPSLPRICLAPTLYAGPFEPLVSALSHRVE